MSLDAEVVSNVRLHDQVRVTPPIENSDWLQADGEAALSQHSVVVSTPDAILSRLGGDSLSLDTDLSGQASPRQSVVQNISELAIGDMYDPASDSLLASESSAQQESVADDVNPVILDLEKQINMINVQVRAAEIRKTEEFDQAVNGLRSQLAGIRASAGAMRTHGISKAQALLDRAKELAVEEVQRAEIIGAEKVLETKQAVGEHEKDMARDDLSPMRRIYLEGWNPEEKLAEALGEEAELRKLAEFEAEEALVAAKDKARTIIIEANKRAKELLDTNEPKIEQRLKEIKKQFEDEITRLRAAAESKKADISDRIIELEYPHLYSRRKRGRVNIAKPRRPRGSVLPESRRGRRFTAAVLTAGFVAGLGLAANSIFGEGGDTLSAEEIHDVAIGAAEVPDWENFPQSIAAWQEEMATTLQDPRIAVKKDGETINYVLGNGTSENPGYANVLYSLMMVESQGDPARADKIPLIAVSPQDGEELSKEMGLDAPKTVADAAKNVLLVNERHLNDIIANLMSSPERADYEAHPEKLYKAILENWGVDVQLNADGVAQICVDWNNDADKSEVFNQIASDATWKGLFDTALQSVSQNKILSAAETK